MVQINAGRVRFVSRGEYDNSTQYYIFDLITYNGNSYYAKKNTLGTLPTNTEYWQLIAEKGNTGSKGPVGATGNGISNISKTGTSGLVDTYTITYTNGQTTTYQITNGEDGEVTQEQLDKVQAELDYYKMLENALPKVEGEGESITLEDTAKCPMKLGFKGQIQQDGEPTPTNPIDIHIVSGDNEVKVCNKNLLELDVFNVNNQKTFTANGVTATLNDDETITLNGTASTNTDFYIRNNNVESTNKKVVFFAIDGRFTGRTGMYCYTAGNQDGKSVNLEEIGKGEVNLVGNKTYTLFEIYARNGNVYNNARFGIMVVDQNLSIATFEPHKEYTKEINLGELEVGGIGDYEDEFFKNTIDSEYYDSTLELDKWYLKKRIGKVVLDGSEQWVLESMANTFGLRNSTLFNDRKIFSTSFEGLLCNYYKVSSSGDYYIRWRGSNEYNINIHNKDISSADDFKTWLSTHNTDVYYVLATPTNTLLNDTLQETLDSFYSMQGQTNISQDNNDIPFVIKASAIRDMTGIYDI